MRAAVDGGFRVIEFTLTTPGALELITEFARSSGAGDDALIVGAGTVLTVEQARQSVSAGASFLVSPITDAAIVAEAHRLDVPCIPGAFTPAEMVQAQRLGADIIKVFPAVPGGPAYIEAVLAPLPDLKLFPTAGVTAENFPDFLAAGCVGVGFVKSLFTADDMASRNLGAIRERALAITTRLSRIG